jgi:hypothetical protein
LKHLAFQALGLLTLEASSPLAVRTFEAPTIWPPNRQDCKSFLLPNAWPLKSLDGNSPKVEESLGESVVIT